MLKRRKPDPAEFIPDELAALYDLINDHRASLNLGRLAVNRQLEDAAMAKTAAHHEQRSGPRELPPQWWLDLEERSRPHFLSDGRGPAEFAAEHGWNDSVYEILSEVINDAVPSPRCELAQVALDGWLNSPPHRGAIELDHITVMGAGMSYTTIGTGKGRPSICSIVMFGN